MKICDECKKEFDDNTTFYQGYCKSCYAKIWDSGFESTSDHAYKIGFDELVQDLDEPNKSEEAAKELVNQWNPEWKCSKCNKIIIENDSQLKQEDKVKKILQKCECGGQVVPTPPKKYFH